MTSLPASALTSVDKLRTRLGCEVDPDLLVDMIVLASEQIESYLGGVPIHYRPNIVEHVAGQGTPELCLRSAPIVEVISVTGDATPVFDVDHEAGMLIARRGSTWTWSPGLVAGSMREPIGGHDARNYVVTYSAGWRTPNQPLPAHAPRLPASIQEAAIKLAAYHFNRINVDPGIASESLLSYSVSYENSSAGIEAGGMPTMIARMLAGWRRMIQE